MDLIKFLGKGSANKNFSMGIAFKSVMDSDNLNQNTDYKLVWSW